MPSTPTLCAYRFALRCKIAQQRPRQKAGLNRGILDAAWGEFARQLTYSSAGILGLRCAAVAAATEQAGEDFNSSHPRQGDGATRQMCAI